MASRSGMKAAGAISVTGVCVARWLGWDWESHVPLLERVTAATDDPFAWFAGTHQFGLRHT